MRQTEFCSERVQFGRRQTEQIRINCSYNYTSVLYSRCYMYRVGDCKSRELLTHPLKNGVSTVVLYYMDEWTESEDERSEPSYCSLTLQMSSSVCFAKR